MKATEIEKVLWHGLLTRLLIEWNSSIGKIIDFVLDKGVYEGINTFEFQKKAIKLLDYKGILVIHKNFYGDGVIPRAQASLHALAGVPELGYELSLNLEALKKLIRRLESGSLFYEEKALFELSFESSELVMTDLASKKEYVLYKPKYQSPSYRLLNYLYSNRIRTIDRSIIKELKLDSLRSFNSIIQDMNFEGVLRKLCIQCSTESLTIHWWITERELKAQKIKPEEIVAYLESHCMEKKNV